MKKYIVFIGIGLVLILTGAYMGSQKNNTNTNRETLTGTVTYSNETYGFSFDYKKGNSGYTLTENETEDLLVILTHQSELHSFSTSTPGEYPPAITVRIYENKPIVPPDRWLQKNAQRVLPVPSSEKEVVLPVGKGLSFESDGLYRTQHVLLSKDQHVYLISGEYIDRESQIAKDFFEIINTFRFLQ